jgi:hypothetical protein
MIVPYRHRPAHQPRQPVAQAGIVGCTIVAATKRGGRSTALPEPPSDPEADARVQAFFARMIRPPGE